MNSYNGIFYGALGKELQFLGNFEVRLRTIAIVAILK